MPVLASRILRRCGRRQVRSLQKILIYRRLVDPVGFNNVLANNRPKNWVSNTFVVATGLGVIAYGLWNLSSEKEVRVHAV